MDLCLIFALQCSRSTVPFGRTAAPPCSSHRGPQRRRPNPCGAWSRRQLSPPFCRKFSAATGIHPGLKTQTSTTTWNRKMTDLSTRRKYKRYRPFAPCAPSAWLYLSVHPFWLKLQWKRNRTPQFYQQASHDTINTIKLLRFEGFFVALGVYHSVRHHDFQGTLLRRWATWKWCVACATSKPMWKRKRRKEAGAKGAQFQGERHFCDIHWYKSLQ